MSLESEIYKLSFELSEILDGKEINKLLGILSSDGVYAMWVYAMDKLDWNFSENKEDMKNMKLFKLLYSISELDKYVSKKIRFDDKFCEELAKLTQEINYLKKKKRRDKIEEEKLKNKIEERNQKFQKLNQYFKDLAQDLNKLLFMKELLEKVFIYALYHAHAKEKSK
uniref:Uncharacterized protein n=1 Tax=candidate division WOR-3 bacterium TaxID=2052148 RepID=A0A7V4E3R8_UNCW3